MAGNWKGIQSSTIKEYLRGEEVNIMLNQKVLALIQSKKRVSYNHSGQEMEWVVRKKRNRLAGYGDAQGITSSRLNRCEKASLDWRGYVMAEHVTDMDKAKNKGKEAQVNFVSKLTEDMLEDAKVDFGREVFLDGNASGGEEKIYGFRSALSFTDTTNQYPTPNDTYAGLSTGLGSIGGSVISGAWPTGQFDEEYYFWSPLGVNYKHANFGATTTWAANCINALRLGIIHSLNNKGKQGQMDLIDTNAAMYGEFLDALDEKERIEVKRNGEKSGLVALGFTNVVNFDGVDVSYEVDCEAGSAYGLNINAIELCSMDDQLFVPREGYDVTNLADQYVIRMFGNMKLNPRALTFWDDFGN